MLLLRRILVPTDHGDGAARAFRMAARLAAPSQAEVRLLHVLTVPGTPPPAPALAVPDGLVCTYQVLTGPHPVPLLADAAAESDLVVMARADRPPAGHAARSQTVDGLVRLTDAPVWIVAPSGPEAPARLLVPVDFGPLAGVSLHTADAVAAVTGAVVDVLHVVDLPRLPSVYGVGPSLDALYPDVEARVTKALRVMLQAHIAPERRGEAVVTCGDPALAVPRVASERSADLIVVSAHAGDRPPRTTPGRVADALLRDARCSLLLLQPSRRPLRSSGDLPAVYRDVDYR